MEEMRRAMPPVPQSVIRQADKLRLAGNEYYKKGRFGAAIDAYTEAIVLYPEVASCWTNRAQCFRKRKEWVRVEEDCKKAIEFDSSSFKAHYFLGLALLEKKEYAEGVKELEKAFDLGRALKPDGYIMEEIWQILAKAKYLNWEQEASKRSWKLQKLKEACEKALTEHYMLEYDPSQPEDVLNEAASTHLEQLEYLSEVFDKAEIADRQAEVPDYLCCKITLEIFRDPVITPSGITYERTMLLDHLRKVGQFDPTTREPLEQHQLVPNLAIKEAVRAFLEEHGWAYKTLEAPTVILE